MTDEVGEIGTILWEPGAERAASEPVARFRAAMAAQHGRDFSAPDALHAWSIENRESFWEGLREFCGVRMQNDGPVLENGDAMPGARWYPRARLNLAENLLRAGSSRAPDDDAIVFRGENGATRRLSWSELERAVTRCAAALAADGIGRGDRVAAYLPNIPEAIIAMLAASSLGAVWSSCSPDFGVEGVHDRFGQIEPVVLLTADGYRYADRIHSSVATVSELARRMPSVRRVVVVPFIGGDDDGRDAGANAGANAAASDRAPTGEGAAALTGRAADIARSWSDWLADAPEHALSFEALPFDHPLYVMFSSGTTGKPKCIVHGQGGTLLQHLKEHALHAGVAAGDRIFFFTTCGWMMWNWLVGGLGTGATIMLYDGSPFQPDGNTLFRYAAEERFTHLGTSAKFIDACNKARLRPGQEFDLGALRTLMSTGSPLLPESFDYVYEHVKRDVCLSSMSGGTDIVSCFALGDPTRAVRRGELQCLGLGMAVEAFDAAGRALGPGETGELVCTRAFPSMPVGFWNDADGSRYHAAYFARYPNVWCHGDWVERTAHGGLLIHGRSDATLNPGGVRIGTAEIYRQVESFDEIIEALVIGQDWDGDTRVVLFVRLAAGVVLDEDLVSRIRTRVRERASPRHVPARVVAVGDIPRTRSGKIVELAVRRVVHGQRVDNIEALANPEALELYRGLDALAT